MVAEVFRGGLIWRVTTGLMRLAIWVGGGSTVRWTRVDVFLLRPAAGGYPTVSELHRFLIAVARIAVNNDSVLVHSRSCGLVCWSPLLKELGLLVLSVSLILFLGVLHRDSGVGTACLVSLSSGMLLIVGPTFQDIWSKPCAHCILYFILMVRMTWPWEEGGEEYLLRCMKCGLARG